MPKLEGQESSILPAEEPPNYDQSEYEEKESQLWVRIRSFEISKKKFEKFSISYRFRRTKFEP